MDRTVLTRAFDDGTDSWEIGEARPAAALAGHVERYGVWRERTRSFTTRRELAATHGVFIVNLGAPLEIVDAHGDLIRLKAGEGFVGGIAQGTSLSRSTGEMAGVHVHLPAAELARVAGVPLAAIADRVVRLDEVAGTAGRVLGSQLVEAADVEARFELLDGFLARRFAAAPSPDPALAAAFGHLRRHGRASALAERFGWSRKRLARWFRDETGLRPAQFARLARFERLTGALAAEPDASLAGLAADTGYADQAHMTHDVRRLSGMTPGELRARLIPAGGGVRD